MTPEQRQNLDKLLAAALERKSEERQAYLDEVCTDASVRREVDSLLADQERTQTGFPEYSELPTEPFQSGAHFGQYTIVERLGAGGMGVVYCAADNKLGRRVALKVLPAKMARDLEKRARFQREARALAALNHAHIVTLYSIEEVNGIHFLTMELVQGESLDQLIRRRGVDFGHVRQIIIAIAEALAAAHGRSIIHRDLKPSNVMLTAEGRVKVLDFGLAKEIPTENAAADMPTAAIFTNPQLIMGTPAYMSPEQALGEPLTAASDIFSLGIISYQMVTGRHPFDADSIVGILHSIATRQPLPPSRLAPEIPASFEALVMRMLEKQPGKRCTAAEVISAFGGSHSVAPGLASEPEASSRRMTGRKKELAELQASFERAAKGNGCLMSVSGEPGQGKTTLIDEFLLGLTGASQALVGRGRCSERLAGAEAYLPVLEALDSLLDGTERELVAASAKSLAPSWYALLTTSTGALQAEAPSQERLKRELAALLVEISRQRPLVIFLDDVHWADISTVDLLSYLGTKLDGMHMLILTSYRAPELRTSSPSFLKLQWELQSRGVCRELALDFFSPDETRSCIEVEFPGNHFPPEFSQLLHDRTEGNPLFVVDLLRYLRERRGIVFQDDRWILSGSLTETLSGLPETIRSMLHRKIGQLDENDRKLLMTASIQGADFEAAVVARALEMDIADIEELLDALQRKSDFVRFVEEHEYPNHSLTPRYRFVHGLYQNAFYAALRPARRSSLSKRVADALSELYGDQAGKIAAQLAFLFEAARDFERAAEHYQQAAQSALLLFANHEAETLARRGLRAVESLADEGIRARRELALQKVLAAALRNLQSHSGREVSVTLQRVYELAEHLGDEPTLFAVHYGLAWSHHTHQEFAKALEQAERCLRIAQDPKNSVLAAAAFLVLGDIETHQGRLRESRQHLQLACDHYDPANAALYGRIIGSNPGVHAKGALGLVLAQMGFPQQGKTCLGECLTLGRRLQNPIAHGVALLCTILGYKHFREEGVLQQASEELTAVCLENELHSSMLYFAKFGQGWGMALQGNSQEGLSKIDEAIAGALAVGLTYGIPMLAYGKAEVMKLAGHAEAACRFLDEQIAAAERCGQFFYSPDLHRLQGEILLHTGAGAKQAARAEECFLSAIENAQRTGAKLCELEAAISLSELYRAQNRKPEAIDLLGALYGWFAEGFDAPPLKRADALLKELSR